MKGCSHGVKRQSRTNWLQFFLDNTYILYFKYFSVKGDIWNRDRDRHGSWIHNYLCNAIILQSVWLHISTNVVSSNPTQAKCTWYNILWKKNSVTFDRLVVFFGYMVSSINKTDHHNITDILLKVALNTISPIIRAF